MGIIFLAGNCIMFNLLYFLGSSSSSQLPNQLQSYRRCSSTGAADVMFVIGSQGTAAHTQLARLLQADLLAQAPMDITLRVYLMANEFSSPGGWTLLDLFSEAQRLAGGAHTSWVVFCQEATRINLTVLLETLNDYDCSGWYLVGRSLRDRRRAARHHYASATPDATLLYPFPGAGFAITMALVKRMSRAALEPQSKFTIDPYYEMAETIYLNTNVKLKNDERFCFKYTKHCATAPIKHAKCERVPRERMYFAIKTFRENHSTKARHLKDTWATHAPHYHFFSDCYDTALPALDTGTTNTLFGHCHKSITILKLIVKLLSSDFGKKYKWIILTDDDTVLSVRRMEEALGCFENESEPIMIGERYGYGYGNKQKGYDFVTGGGGVAISAAAARELAQCACAVPDAPDDMWLGACAHQRSVTVLHHDGFHQGRPEDYAAEYLGWIPPVSFHGLDASATDPHSIYDRWFRNADEQSLLHSDSLGSCGGNVCVNSSKDEL